VGERDLFPPTISGTAEEVELLSPSVTVISRAERTYGFGKVFHGFVEDFSVHNFAHETFDGAEEVLFVVASLSELGQEGGQRI
jgi:hypothetical protein